MKTTYVIGYLAFSSKQQATGDSERRQTTGYADFCAQEGFKAWTADTYFDKGKSRFHGSHREGDFGRLIDDVKARKFPSGSVIWFEDMDRFGRQELPIVLNDWHTITSNGYVIHVGSLGMTFDKNTDQMRLMGVILKAILAHEESLKKSIRGKENRAQIRKTGRTIKGEKRRLKACPFWISVGDDGEYHLNEHAQLVKEAFRLAHEGHGAKTIKGMLGTHHDILGILRNRAVIGEFTPESRHRGDHEKQVAGSAERHHHEGRGSVVRRAADRGGEQ